MSGTYFIVQTSKFVLITVTAVNLCQGNWKVIQYISPNPYTICSKYVSFCTNSFDVRGKSLCGGGGCVGRGGRGGRGGNEQKHEVTPDGVT